MPNTGAHPAIDDNPAFTLLERRDVQDLGDKIRGLNMTMIRVVEVSSKIIERAIYADEREARIVALLEQIATNTAGIPALVDALTRTFG